MKILITGIKGQLGYELYHMLKVDNEVYGIDIDDLDITDTGKTIEYIKNLHPEVVINPAAYTNVDGCEQNPDLAYRVNVIGPQNIAVACTECNARMVQLSTDFVFDGESTKPYIEFDSTNPLSVYGKSKLAGESIVKEILPRHYIVRTAWLYGLNGNNFVKTMLKLASDKDVVKVVDDQIGTPTYTKDLSEVIYKLIKSDMYGTYHCSNKGEISWYMFAKRIFELANINMNVEPISTKELGRPAKRPRYSVLRNYMLELTIGDSTREWEDALSDYISKL